MYVRFVAWSSVSRKDVPVSLIPQTNAHVPCSAAVRK